MNFRVFLICFFALGFPLFSQAKSETGEASYYADKFAGKPTSSGEAYDPKMYTAAHREYPPQTVVKVTNIANGKSVIVRINDKLAKKTRVIDLSKVAAEKIDMIQAGVAQVKVEYIGTGTAGKNPDQAATAEAPKKDEKAVAKNTVPEKTAPSKKPTVDEDDFEDEEEEEEEDPDFAPPAKKAPAKTPEKSVVTPTPAPAPAPSKTVTPSPAPTKTAPTKTAPAKTPVTAPTTVDTGERFKDFEGKVVSPTGVGLQIGAYSSEAMAIKHSTKLMLRGYPKNAIEKFEGSTPVMHRVIIYGFASEEEALKAGKELEKIGYSLYFIYKFQ